MSTRTEVLLWAQRVIARKTGPAHELLELPADATPDDAQAAFHGIARNAHPDLHRHGLTREELELVTSAYAVVAGAYQTLRTQTNATVRMKPLKPEDLAAAGNASPARPGRPTASPLPSPVAAPAQPGRPTASPLRSSPVASPARPARPMSVPLASAVPVTPSETAPGATPSPPAGGAAASQSMSSKALIYFRKAELCLKRGDLKGAVLQIKLAIAADPTSGFLRSALAEVELEVRKVT